MGGVGASCAGGLEGKDGANGVINCCFSSLLSEDNSMAVAAAFDSIREHDCDKFRGTLVGSSWVYDGDISCADGAAINCLSSWLFSYNNFANATATTIFDSVGELNNRVYGG